MSGGAAAERMAEYGAHDPPSPATDPCLVVVVPPPRHRLRRVIVAAATMTTVAARLRRPVRGGRMKEGGAPLHHPLRVEHRRGGGNDGIGVVVPASVSASVLVDIEGSTPHVQQAVVRHRCGEVVVLLIGDDSAPPPSDRCRRRSRRRGRRRWGRRGPGRRKTPLPPMPGMLPLLRHICGCLPHSTGHEGAAQV